MALAGALEIQMFASISRLSKDINEAKSIVGRGMKGIESAAGTAMRALSALGLGIGLVGLGRMVKGALEAQDALSKLSQKLNVSVESLAGYQHAADLAGVSNESLTKAFKTLSSQMFDSSMGLAESKRNFATLGIEVKKTDGTLKNADTVMIEVADRFAKMNDGAAKSALAVKLFGKAGLDMIPMLNEGSAAIAAMVAEGKRLNPVTAESARQAEIFNDNLTRVEKSAKTAGISLLNNLLPAMAAISKEMAKAATMPGGGFWAALLAGAQTALTGDDTLKNLQERARLAQQIGAAMQAIEINTKSFGEEDKRTIAAKESLVVLRTRMATSMEYYKVLQQGAKAEADAEALRKAGKKDAVVKDAESNKKAADDYKKLLDLGTKGEIDAMIAREKAWSDEQKAINDLKNDSYDEDKKLLELGVKGEEDAALARVAAVQGEMVAINEARNAGFEADKLRQQERQREFMDLWNTVERTGKDVFVQVFSNGKNAFEGIGKAIKASVIDLLWQLTARKWIISIGATLSGEASAASSASSGISMLGGASNIASFAGAAGGLFGTAAAGVPVTSTIGAVASGAGYVGAGSTGLMGTAGAAAGAIPVVGWIALAALAAYAIFSENEGDAQRTGNWRAGLGQVGSSTQNKWFDASTGTGQLALDMAAQEQQIATLLKLSTGQTATINTALDALSGKQYGFGMEHTDWTQSGAAAAIAADRFRIVAESLGISVEALAQKLVNAQKVIDLAPQKLQLEIDLMKAQGDAVGALAAERKRELDALDPMLRGLQNQIYAAQDLAAAANDAAAAVNDAGDAIAKLAELLSETQSAVNTQIGQSRSMAQAARQAAESFKRIGEALADAVTAIRGGGRSGAGGRLDALFGAAMTGNASALSGLPQAGQDFLSASLSTARTSLEFARDQAKVVTMLNKAQIVSEAMVNWNEYQATLLELQTGVLEAIRDQLALPSPDAAILTQQMNMLGTIAGLLQEQTVQIVSGSGMQALLMHDQTGQIIQANALTVDQTGQVVLGNSWLGTQAQQLALANSLVVDQTGQVALGNSLVGTQTGQIITGNATQDVIKNITALNTSYSEQQLAALVASGSVQSNSLTALVTGNAMMVSLLQQLIAIQGAVAMADYDAKFQEAVGTIWASVQAAGGTLGDFDSQFAAWKAANPMPSYAVGTNYVPTTGPAILHRGERVTTAAANDELVIEIRRLNDKVDRMQRDTRKSADTLEAVANGQLAFSTEAA